MKALGIIAAAVAGFLVAPAPAAAYVGAPVVQSSVATVELAPIARVVDRRDDRRWDRDRGRGWDRGRHRGWRNRERTRSVCRTEWRRGHRERVCRQVRYR